MSEREKIKHRYCKGAFVLSKYDTELDARRARADIIRFLRSLSMQSFEEIMQELAPYRAQASKPIINQYQYDELAKELSDYTV